MPDSADEVLGEVAIELPYDNGEFRNILTGYNITVYSYETGLGLKMLDNVTSVYLDMTASSPVTAIVTQRAFPGDEERVSKCYVVGWRIRKGVGR